MTPGHGGSATLPDQTDQAGVVSAPALMDQYKPNRRHYLRGK